MLDKDLLIMNIERNQLNQVEKPVINFMVDSHELKTINPYFDLVWNNKKLFEWRLFDRDYKPFDELILREYNSSLVNNSTIKNEGVYLLRKIHCNIGFIMMNSEKFIQIQNKLNNDFISSCLMPVPSIPFDHCLMSIVNLTKFVLIDNQWKEIE